MSKPGQLVVPDERTLARKLADSGYSLIPMVVYRIVDRRTGQILCDCADLDTVDDFVVRLRLR
jgi:hypothetical protein